MMCKYRIRCPKEECPDDKVKCVWYSSHARAVELARALYGQQEVRQLLIQQPIGRTFEEIVGVEVRGRLNDR